MKLSFSSWLALALLACGGRVNDDGAAIDQTQQAVCGQPLHGAGACIETAEGALETSDAKTYTGHGTRWLMATLPKGTHQVSLEVEVSGWSRDGLTISLSAGGWPSATIELEEACAQANCGRSAKVGSGASGTLWCVEEVQYGYAWCRFKDVVFDDGTRASGWIKAATK